MEKVITPMLRRIFWIALAIFLLLLSFTWVFSPYKSYQTGVITSEVDINADCQQAFKYLGNSDNAKKWSVFVSFIETINPDQFQDGMIGSKRMCYTKEDKTGFTWEEEVLERRENEYRKISCYNFQNLFIKSPNLVTEQIYSPSSSGCKVTFTLDFKEEPTFLDKMKMKFSAYRVKSIFDRNLANIKSEVQKDRP